ncbi:PilW family protein [Variovorax sp. Root473]|uniref:PilW family protein n=1 Tax=Variovorax sp. Root473 TaxID=1736541 RepID=UPI0006F23855|nr:PilW family protein [Variovorax sp. Root473]KQX87642.1 hypothetical protein ASD34_15330 [Variovorax sp. Root473]
MSATANPCARMRHPARGFTLIELLISLAIGLVILAAGLSVFATSSRSSQLSEVETQMNEDGILALNLIQQQLKQAGFSQQLIPSNGATVMGNYAGPAVRGCDGGFVDAAAAFDQLSCVKGDGSDAIAIRYEATPDNTIPLLTDPTVATNCLGNSILPLTPTQVSPRPTPAAGTSLADHYTLADNRYLVIDAKTTPMLSCRGMEKRNTANIIGAPQPLLANVESMQILYGVASRPSAELAATYDPLLHQIVDYHEASDVDKLSETIEDRWGRVLSVRVCLLMRSDRPVRDAPEGGMTYKRCDNADETGTDGYLRRTYTTTVLLRNRLIAP